MLAAILNLQIEIVKSEEGPGYGAAILAAIGCGEFSSVKEATDRLVKVVEVIKPEPELVEKYNKQYEKFRKLYDLTRQFKEA